MCMCVCDSVGCAWFVVECVLVDSVIDCRVKHTRQASALLRKAGARSLVFHVCVFEVTDITTVHNC